MHLKPFCLDESEWFDWSIYYLSATWSLVGLAALPGNFLVMWLTIAVENLRTTPTNWFLFNLALCDFIFSLSVILESVAVHFPHSTTCSFAAFVMYSSGTVSFYFPPLIAWNRYVHLCRVGKGNYSNLHYQKLFSARNVTFMNLACWFFCTAFYVGFFPTNRLGAGKEGYCAVAISDSVPLLLYFYTVIILSALVAYATVIIFYRKVEVWVREQTSKLSGRLDPQVQNTIRDTNAYLKMMRWICVLPAIFQMPGIIAKFIVNFYDLPLWAGRIMIGVWLWICFLNPWITLLVIRPYKKALAASKIGRVGMIGNMAKVEPIDEKV